MATLLQNPSGKYHVDFYFGGTRFKRSLGTSCDREAEARRKRLEETIRLAVAGRIEIPTGVDLPAFLLSDGKIPQRMQAEQTLTLSQLFDRFFALIPGGALETSTISGMQRHYSHFRRILGPRFAVQQMTVDDLQQYVNQRATEPGRRDQQVSTATIKKELRTFSSIWSRGAEAKWLTGRFPTRGLRLPKTEEKPPFQTWDAIQRKIDRGGLSAEQQEKLWECLFLSLPETSELLEHVRQHALHPFIYPMFVFAAHTGARRSEMMRSQVDDIDLEAGVAAIREKKRVRGTTSRRHVPLSDFARKVLQAWLESHPGGEYTFCLEGNILRSNNRSSTPRAISPNEAHDHFQRVLARSKWENVRGWHVFRHSFCSNCAAAGVDQRLINAWTGHQTDEMVRRYRHLLPNQQRTEMARVFHES